MLLGIDYGKTHIGVAIGDHGTRLAFPLQTFSGLAHEDLLFSLRQIIASHGVEKIIVGIPRSLQPATEQGSLEKEVREFAKTLAQDLALPVETVDERFTSDAAAKLRHEHPQGDEHALAAMLILQSYFDS